MWGDQGSVAEEPMRIGKGEVALESNLALGHEEGVERRRRHTSARRSEARRQCGMWVTDFMQPWPGAVENGVGVVPL